MREVSCFSSRGCRPCEMTSGPRPHLDAPPGEAVGSRVVACRQAHHLGKALVQSLPQSAVYPLGARILLAHNQGAGWCWAAA